ncbi:iron-sulfur cluster assembly scaffold protein [Asticcacaulis sp. ZE23SCel15]|uniref:iron-sulfur cluster assembly scaffold protein n=1 Tax=Asticcacaulis sp. ZE23SCel15 TaxID=3059027 RepID=UPI0026603E23|nr:iron-sulfur cluster assembly scaffold protein [Asticcacaulis sp. ZE23SCel15]WKL58544.1 iron-sulfur cluster assembly scaffold protein [Asticcacaulis sp. ZE23SCel15]
MIDELYSREILKRTTQLMHVGRLEAPDGTAERTSKLCGSHIVVDVKMDGDVVSDFAHDVEACALGQASAAILSQHVIGATVAEITAARDALKAMLKGDEVTFPERFADLAILKSVKDFPARHTSTQLAFEATVSAINEVKNKAA